MTLAKFLAVATMAASTGLGTAEAQSISDRQTPAEFPPADYKAAQYVDSRGCVYIRSGVEGAIDWVPRVTRDRKVICGFKPTFDAAARPAISAPSLDENVVQIEPAAPPTERPSLFGNARPTPKADTAPTPSAPVATIENAQPPRAAPQQARQAAPKPKAAPAKTAAAITVKPERRPAQQTPRVAPLKVPVVQLPVAELEAPVVAPVETIAQAGVSLRPPAGTVVRAGEVAPDVRVVAKHIYEARQKNEVTSVIPEGYRRAFDDGRLDTQRAVVTFAGQAQMQKVWTSTVPRRLIEAEVDPTEEKASAPVSTVSSKAASAQKTLRLGTTPYVQLAATENAAQAQKAARKLRKLDLPVRIGRYERGGAVQRMVLVGPFASSEEAASVLAKVQGAGFGEAFLRN